MKEQEWSRDSEAFKTISSYSDTRNQTSKKKYYSSQPKKSKKKHINYNSQDISYMRQSLSCLKQKVKSYAYNKKYSKLSKTQAKINSLKSQLKNGEIFLLEKQHKKEQKRVYDAHYNEMQKFNEVWEEMFQNFQLKKQQLYTKFQQEQERDKKKAQKNLSFKASRVKPVDNTLRNLNKLQDMLLRNEKYEELIKLNIGVTKKGLKKQLKNKQIEEITKLQQIEEEKFERVVKQKHRSLKMRIQEGKKYHEKIYLKQEKRLRQKFLNILNQLKHRQVIEKHKYSSSFHI